MTQAFLTQTDFTAGELDPRMLGRTDLRSYQSGAAKLRNVVVETTGGVRRRPGTAFVANAAGPGRLVAMETAAEQAYLLAFSDFQVKIFRDGVLRATVATPWNQAQVGQISWAQRRQSLLVTHPDVRPQELIRQSDTVWTIGPWSFVELAPGIHLERDVLAHMQFRPKIADDLRTMDRRLFGPEPMGLSADLEAVGHAARRPRRRLPEEAEI